jgi:hypothetical protein
MLWLNRNVERQQNEMYTVKLTLGFVVLLIGLGSLGIFCVCVRSSIH